MSLLLSVRSSASTWGVCLLAYLFAAPRLDQFPFRSWCKYLPLLIAFPG